jgi:hypothetical protein
MALFPSGHPPRSHRQRQQYHPGRLNQFLRGLQDQEPSTAMRDSSRAEWGLRLRAAQLALAIHRIAWSVLAFCVVLTLRIRLRYANRFILELTKSGHYHPRSVSNSHGASGIKKPPTLSCSGSLRSMRMTICATYSLLIDHQEDKK